MQPQQILAQPFTLPNGTVIPNRLVKAAMSEALGTADGHPTPRLNVLYQRWAEGGVGLNITGNVMIDRRALGEPHNVVVENESDLADLRRWAEASTQNGCQIWMQINHPGKQAPKALNKETVAPSAIPLRGDMASTFFAIPRELTIHEIEDLIQRFGKTAAIAKKAGFTGVQIHGAHGYLISQFLSPYHNQRTDEWGGSAEKRRSFALAILKEIRQQVGDQFPIGIKLNSSDFQRGGFTEEESLDTIRALTHAGIDLVEISGGTYEAPAMTGLRKVKESTRKREAYFLEFTEKVRSEIKVPLMLTGGFRSSKGMVEAISSGAVDFIGLGRPLAIDPELPQRLLNSQEAVSSVRAISTGIKAIDRMGLLEITWYTRQIQRMARGDNPRPNESALRSLILSALERGWKAFETRRLRA